MYHRVLAAERYKSITLCDPYHIVLRLNIVLNIVSLFLNEKIICVGLIFLYLFADNFEICIFFETCAC